MLATHPIVQRCAELFGVPADVLLDSTYRYAGIMPARFALYAALRKRGCSERETAQIIGRDRSTIRHGVRRADYTAARDPLYAAKIERLSAVLIVPETFRPPSPDVFDFVCHVTVMAAVSAGVPAEDVAALLRVPVQSLGRFTAKRFEEQWGSDPSAAAILWQTTKHFPQKAVA